MTDLETLIADLEAAEEGSRKLDYRIHALLHNQTSEWVWEQDFVHHDIPHYTTSLDAALTLYRDRPDFVPSDPRLTCVDALRNLP